VDKQIETWRKAEMMIELRRDPQGKLIPPSKEELAAALAVDDTIPKKHNGPVIEGQSFLETALQGERGAVKAFPMKEENL
jgi:hypothetical protein